MEPEINYRARLKKLLISFVVLGWTSGCTLPPAELFSTSLQLGKLSLRRWTFGKAFKDKPSRCDLRQVNKIVFVQFVPFQLFRRRLKPAESWLLASPEPGLFLNLTIPMHGTRCNHARVDCSVDARQRCFEMRQSWQIFALRNGTLYTAASWVTIKSMILWQMRLSAPINVTMLSVS